MSEKLVTLAVLSYTRAEILQGRLEANGIESFIVNEHAIRPTYPNDVRVRIREEDATKALPIALHLKEEYAISTEEFEMLSEDLQLLLVPIDFSEHSHNAFEYAYNIAVQLQTDIKLVHVFFDASVTPVAAIDSYAYHVGFDIDLHEIEKNAKDEIEKFIQHFKEKYDFEKDNVKVDYELIGGATEECILNFAKEQKADAIIMGTQGVGKSESVFFGSITAAIIEEADIPVLAIPKISKFGGFSDPTTVLYVTNFEPSDYLSIRKLMRLLYVFNIKIYCMHIENPESKELDEIRMESLKNHLSEEYSGYEIECISTKNKDIVESIENVLAETPMDFVALSTHRSGILEDLFSPSLTQKVLKHTHKPLLVFHV